jgi:hypothetical protein
VLSELSTCKRASTTFTKSVALEEFATFEEFIIEANDIFLL